MTNPKMLKTLSDQQLKLRMDELLDELADVFNEMRLRTVRYEKAARS